MALHSSAAPSARNRYRISPLSLVLQRALTGQRHMQPWPNPFTGMARQDVYNAFEICFREEYQPLKLSRYHSALSTCSQTTMYHPSQAF